MVQQANELVADQGSIEAEEEGQEQPGAHSIEEHCTGEENQREDAETGQYHLADSKAGRSFVHERSHDGIRLISAPLKKLQRKKGVQGTHNHNPGGQEEKPGMVPIGKYRLGLSVTTGRVSARPRESEKNRTPGKFPTICFHSVLFVVVVLEVAQHFPLVPLIIGPLSCVLDLQILCINLHATLISY